MKNIIRIKRVLFFLLIGFSALLHTSCEEEDIYANASPPSIEMVRLTTVPDSAINAAQLGVTIAIKGTNLAATTGIVMNGRPTAFNPVLATNTHLVITIPEETPTLATDDNVPNSIIIQNPAGEVSYDFTILPPPAVIEHISNEFASAGQEITLSGSFFYFVEEVIFPGDVSTTSFTPSADGKSLKVIVPEGFSTEGGTIHVISQSGVSSTVGNPRFQDMTGLLYDYEDPSKVGWSGAFPVVNGDSNPDIPSLMGNYGWIHGENIGTNSWWVDHTAMFVDASVIDHPPFADNTPASQLELRFEIYVKDVWNSGYLEIGLDNWNYWNYWKPWEVEGERTDFITDGWTTVSIGLDEFFMGDQFAVSYGEVKGMLFFNMKNPGEDGGGLPNTNWNFAVDNFRIVSTISAE